VLRHLRYAEASDLLYEILVSMLEQLG